MVHTRAAEIQDASAITRLMCSMKNKNIEPEIITKRLGDFIGNKNQIILVLEDDYKIVQGMATININHQLLTTVAHVDDVVVAAETRGKGYGRIIMEAVESWACNNGADELSLTSRASREAANALYKKIGYKIHDTNVFNKKIETT